MPSLPNRVRKRGQRPEKQVLSLLYKQIYTILLKTKIITPTYDFANITGWYVCFYSYRRAFAGLVNAAFIA